MIDFDVDISAYRTFTEESVKHLGADEQLKILRGLSFKFIGAVIPRTPVDTGRVRGGWTAMPGSVKATVGSYGKIGSRATEGRRMSSYRQGTINDQAFTEITNGVPYVVYLELGSSQQAPSGFVRRTLREMMADEVTEAFQRKLEAEFRLANIKARAQTGLRQGIGSRHVGKGYRYNLERR